MHNHKQVLEEIVSAFINLLCSSSNIHYITHSWSRFISFDIESSVSALENIIETILFDKISFKIRGEDIELFKKNPLLSIPRKHIEKNIQCKNYIKFFEHHNEFFFDMTKRFGLEYYEFSNCRFNYIIEKNFNRFQIVSDFISKLLLISGCKENRIYFPNCIQILRGSLFNIIHKHYKYQIGNISTNSENNSNNTTTANPINNSTNNIIDIDINNKNINIDNNNTIDKNQFLILNILKILYILRQPSLGEIIESDLSRRFEK